MRFNPVINKLVIKNNIKCEIIEKIKEESYPRNKYTMKNSMYNSLQGKKNINTNIQVPSSEHANNDLNPIDLSEGASQSNENEYWYRGNLQSPGSSFKDKDMHSQLCDKSVNDQETLPPSPITAMLVENANSCDGAALPTMSNILHINKNFNTRLFRVYDAISKELFIVDTGSTFSILKASAEDKNDPIGFLTAANGSQINVYNCVSKDVNFLLRRNYTHNFLIADVIENILGIDFFYKI